jgi:hypothetical protein
MNLRSVEDVGVEVAHHRFVLVVVTLESSVGLDLDRADAQLFQRVLDQVAVDDLVVALVVVAQQVVVARRDPCNLDRRSGKGWQLQ